MRTLGPLSTSLWPSGRAPPAAAVSVTGKVTAVTGKLADSSKVWNRQSGRQPITLVLSNY